MVSCLLASVFFLVLRIFTFDPVTIEGSFLDVRAWFISCLYVSKQEVTHKNCNTTIRLRVLLNIYLQCTFFY